MISKESGHMNSSTTDPSLDLNLSSRLPAEFSGATARASASPDVGCLSGALECMLMEIEFKSVSTGCISVASSHGIGSEGTCVGVRTGAELPISEYIE